MAHDKRCSCSRRSFLKGTGLTLTGFGLSSLLPAAFVNHAMAAGAGDERLMFIFLRGGNDGLNAVMPHGDPQFVPAIRPDLYITPSLALNLNDFAYMHPALEPMMDLYNAGELAVIHRVGFPNQSQSHFDGQRIWENGDPLRPVLLTGWMGRYMAAHPGEFTGAIPALTAQPGAPVLLRNEATAFMNISDPAGFYDNSGAVQTKTVAAWQQVLNGFTGSTSSSPYRGLLAESGLRLIDTLDEYQSWGQNLWNPTDPDTGWHLFPVSNATNPPDASRPSGRKFSTESYGFFLNLKIAALAQLEGAANGTRVSGTELQGWDLHVNGGNLSGRHAELLGWLAYGMRSLRIALSGAAVDTRSYPGIWDKTLVVTMSEFGRTTDQNASKGTDHAKASCMWVGGGPVNGGVYNCDPSTWPTGVMYDVEGRYLSHRTDFRNVFWEVLRDHMGAPAAEADAVFPGYTASGLPAGELGLLTGV